MANQCPICSKSFPSETALRGHTGTNEAVSRRAHTCHKYNRRFCSQKAMEQHRDAPSHSVVPSQSTAPSHATTCMFRCDVCKKPFGSKQAVAQHNKSSSHKRKVVRASSAMGVGAPLGSGSASSHQAQSRILGVTSTSIEEATSSDIDSEDEYSDEGAWAQKHVQTVWDDGDQDWALCDKDCGWCGHCADGVDY